MGEVILPGAVIGIIGGGQLGKMLANAAQLMGYQIVIWSEEEDFPASGVATSTVVGKYTDNEKLEQFVERVDVVTVETEHIPLATLEKVANYVPIYPSPDIVAIAQNRKNEKLWLKDNNFSVVPFQIINSIDDIILFKQEIDNDIVIKTITGGYDGKGQLRISSSNLEAKEEELILAWLDEGKELIAEEWLEVATEFSVIAARNARKEFASFPAVENEHRDHILYRSIAPARIPNAVTKKAIETTEKLMELSNYVGLLCVEFFYSLDGELYINELAPRPHNSGHYTIDASITNQFEQTIRSICNLPLGETKSLSPSVMTNLLGNLWGEGELQYEKILSEPMAKLHIYGKKEARKQRKMGHYTTLAESIEEAIEAAERIYKSLIGGELDDRTLFTT